MIMTWLEWLEPLFRDKLIADERIPIHTFALPGVEGVFGLFPPAWEPIKQLLLLITLCQVFQVLFAAIVYQSIIPNRGTMEAYCLGWGFIIPLVLWLPFQMLEDWDIQNLSLKMAVTNLPMIVVFRTVEAMYDTSPPVVESSMLNYITYYTATTHFVWDSERKTRLKVNRLTLWKTFIRVMYYYHLLSLSLSFMKYFDFAPFETPVVLDEFHLNLDIFHPAHIANMYLLAVHTYFHLLVGFEMTSYGENLKGYITRPIFLNPLWSSTSPTDFWGRKWNLMISNVLKYGCFLPSRKFVSTKGAILLSFLMSGLIHDYVWAAIFYHHYDKRDPETGVCQHCFAPTTLKLTAFFLWNGVVMLLEKPLGKLFPFAWISENMPAPIISTMVLMTALPVSHWYTGDWVVGGYFSDFAIALWHIKKLPQ